MNMINSFSQQVAAVLANPRENFEHVERYARYVRNEYFGNMRTAFYLVTPQAQPPTGVIGNLKNKVANIGKSVGRELVIEEMVKAVIIAALVSVVVGALWWLIASAAAAKVMAALTFVPAALIIHSYRMFRAMHPLS